jgi:hypothetical protein
MKTKEKESSFDFFLHPDRTKDTITIPIKIYKKDSFFIKFILLVINSKIVRFPAQIATNSLK